MNTSHTADTHTAHTARTPQPKASDYFVNGAAAKKAGHRGWCPELEFPFCTKSNHCGCIKTTQPAPKQTPQPAPKQTPQPKLPPTQTASTQPELPTEPLMKGGGASHETDPTEPPALPTSSAARDKLHSFQDEFQSMHANIENIKTIVILSNLHGYYSESNLPPATKLESCVSAYQILVQVHTDFCSLPFTHTPGRGSIGMAAGLLQTFYQDIMVELNALHDLLHRYMTVAYGLRKTDTVRRKLLTLTAPIRHFLMPPPEEEKPMSLKLLIESKFGRILEMRQRWLSQHLMLRIQIAQSDSQ
jgi:hypothetical protein